jgi:hypothetical protein
VRRDEFVSAITKVHLAVKESRALNLVRTGMKPEKVEEALRGYAIFMQHYATFGEPELGLLRALKLEPLSNAGFWGTSGSTRDESARMVNYGIITLNQYLPGVAKLFDVPKSEDETIVIIP